MTAILLYGTLVLAAPIAVEPEKISRDLSDKLIQVEDQVTSVLGVADNRRLRLWRCPDVSFRLDEFAPKEITGNVRVVGKVRFESSQVVVEVQKLELLPSDDDRFKKRESAINANDPSDWYELAEWAHKRFSLYQAESMSRAAQRACRKGLDLDRQQAGNDISKLDALRARAISNKIVRDLDLAELDHHRAVARLPNIAVVSADELEQAADRWAKQLVLPEGVRLSSTPEQISAYEKNPVEVYRQSTEAQRLSLSRSMQLRLLRLSAEKRIALGEWDYARAAQWAADHLPEMPELSKRWLYQSIDDEQAKLGQARFRDADKLARRVIDQLQDNARADTIRRSWLELMESAMRTNELRAEQDARAENRSAPPRDVRARYELAQHRLTWFPKDSADQALAAGLYQEALAIEPTFEPAMESLRELGYRRDRQGVWQDPKAAAQINPTDAEQIRSATVGMDDAAVKRILGDPDAHSRFITGPRLEERQWRYQGFKQSTYINFRADGAGRWRVSDIRRVDNESAPQGDQVE
jgi:hypothetical protein